QTLPVKGWTLRHDSIVSLPSPIKMMGSYVDAQVGRTDFGLYFNVNFPQASLSFGDNPTLVSADFVFVTTPRCAGDVNAQVSYSVFTLDSTLNLNRAYYASNNRLHHPVPLPTVTETGTVEDTAGLEIIRVKLDPTFAQQLISDAAALSSQTAFHAKYKG